MDIDDRLAFIVGHYKSGSTWLAHLLALAPQIVSVRECHVFRYAREAENFSAANDILFKSSAWGMGGIKSYPRHWASTMTRGIRAATGLARYAAALPTNDVPTSMHDLGLWRQLRLQRRMSNAIDETEYCKLLFAELLERFNPEAYIVEKTPTNVYELDLLKKIFPRAKLISIHRDGRDVVVSDMHHLRRAYGREEEFSQRVHKWVNAMEAEKQGAVNYDIHQLSYEQLQFEPQETVAQVLDHLGLYHDKHFVERLINGAAFEVSSGGRVAGVEDTSSFQRKGVVGDWRNVFSDSDIREFSKVAGPLLVELGYEKSADWRTWT